SPPPQIHRRLLHDDNRGVAEPLDELGATGTGLVVRGRHLLLLEPPEVAADSHRPLAQALALPPCLLLAPPGGSQYRPGLPSLSQFSGLRGELPPNLHLLTLAPGGAGAGSVLLRLEHQFQLGESTGSSQPVTVDLLSLFSTLSITSVQELTLGADQPLSATSRLLWTPSSG
ncbi:MA2B1 mannosidase, partial [Rhinopomastus cyanomelas]|nr:MA2B1 mannosidase [Rhinopomastus cyanomelas]